MDNTIVGRIFLCMKNKGITQKQVADMLGIGQGTVAGWKQRNCPPPINYISDIANLLGVSIDYLVTGGDNPIKYKLNSDEQYLIRLYRVSSEEDKNAILRHAIALSDEKLYNDTNPRELLDTLQ